MQHPTREEAIKAINDLFDVAFGHDKGSDEAYIDWCEGLGLVTYECDDNDAWPEDWPGQYQFLAALGITEQEMIDILHLNPNMFSWEYAK